MKQVLRIIFIIATLASSSSSLSAQVQGKFGINQNSLDINAAIEVESASKGVLLPRLTTAQQNAMLAPTNGMLIYNTDSACFVLRRAGVWRSLCAANGGEAWSTLGNAGTNANTNFIGTTDAQDVVLKRNNTEGLRLSSGKTINTGDLTVSNRLIAGNMGTLDSLSLINAVGTQTSYTNNVHGLRADFTVTPPSGYLYSTFGGYNKLTIKGANGGNYHVGSLGYVSNENTGTVPVVAGAGGTIFHNSVGTIAGTYGLQSSIYNNSTGTITNAYGTYTQIYNLSTGTITNAYGNYVTPFVKSGGTMTNAYGLYIDNQTAATNNYGIYVNGASTRALHINSGTSYFGGNVGINTTSPTYKLDINAQTGGTGNPLRLLGLNAGATSDSIISSNNGILRRLSINQILSNAWNITGNAGTTAGTNFIGTTDNVPLSMRVNNINALTLGTDTSFYRGSSGNARGTNAVDLQSARSAATQVASGRFSVLGGGEQNTGSGNYSTISGGSNNMASGNVSFIGGGSSNTNSGLYATLVGGVNNGVSNIYAVLVGGQNNTASGQLSFLGGGGSNVVSGTQATIAGGTNNTASGNASFIGGGDGNTNTGIYSMLVGGATNGISNTYAGLVGGQNNTVSGSLSFLGGGSSNTVSGTQSAIAGGASNTVSGNASFIGGGNGNVNSGIYATLVGGNNNVVSNSYSALVGGENNRASNNFTFVGGGFSNVASGLNTAIVGGSGLTLSGSNSFGFNGSGTTPSVSTSNIAYLGDVNLWLGNVNNAAKELRFYEPNSSLTYTGTNYTAFKAGVQLSDITYTLPTADGSANQVLSTNGAGTLSWSNGSAFAWNVLGNSGTTAGTNFIGTTDAQSLVFKTNNAEGMRLNTSGYLGIGTTTPSVNLEVVGLGKIQTASTFNLFLNGGNTTNTGTYNTAIGVNAFTNATTAEYNTAVGAGALRSTTIGAYNTAFGNSSLFANTTGSSNIAFGGGALQANTTGTHNGAVGIQALESSVSGNHNLAVGNYALSSLASGNSNIGLGWGAGGNITSGSDNIIIGFQINPPSLTGSGQLNIGNLLYGTSLGTSSTRSTGNIGINTTTPQYKLDIDAQTGSSGNPLRLLGLNAGATSDSIISSNSGVLRRLSIAQVLGNAWNITGNSGTVDGTNFIGTTDNIPLSIRVNNQRSGYIGVAANGSTFLGYQAGLVNTGTNNTFVGAQAGTANTTGGQNTAVGHLAFNSNTTGTLNTAVGQDAMRLNTTGSQNTALGESALEANTTGDLNVALGHEALTLNSTGAFNVAIGSQSLYSNINANRNLGIGYLSLYTQSFNNAGTSWNSDNMAIGYQALYNNQPTTTTNGYRNIGIGFQSLLVNTTGFGNVALGYQSGNNITTGSNNTLLGYDADVSSATLTNATAIGANATVGASNSLVLGNAVNVGINTSTPQYKLDINAQTGSTGNPLRLLGLNVGATSDSIISSNSGILRRLSINQILANAWNITGNAGTTAGTNFIGTTDAQSLVFKTNNTEWMRLNTTGSLGIGTTSPVYKLQVEEPGGYDGDIAARLYNTNNLTYKPSLQLQASGGTKAAPSAVANTTTLGAIMWVVTMVQHSTMFKLPKSVQ